MVTMAKGGLPFLLFNLRNVLNHRITVLCVTVTLAILVAWQAGSLAWKLWYLNEEPTPPAAIASPPVNNAETEPLQNLLRYPLIRSATATTAQDSASINAPKTSLKLKLVGLMYSTDKDEARAIIETPDDGARSFAIQERVADKAEIYSIEPDRVILNHAGKREALLLDPESEASGSAQAGSGDRPASGSANNPASTGSQAATGQDSKNAPKRTADLMRDFSATPVMENGELRGFRLEAVSNPEIMQEWGIAPNDVITAVNGVALNSPGRLMVLYDKLKKQREFEVTLDNGGNSRTITIDLTE